MSHSSSLSDDGRIRVIVSSLCGEVASLTPIIPLDDKMVCELVVAGRSVYFKASTRDPVALEAWAYRSAQEAGVLVPEVLAVDVSLRRFPAAFLVVEGVSGEEMAGLGVDDPRYRRVAEDLALQLRSLHDVTLEGYGLVDLPHFMSSGRRPRSTNHVLPSGDRRAATAAGRDDFVCDQGDHRRPRSCILVAASARMLGCRRRDPGAWDQTVTVRAVVFDLFETLFTEWRGPTDRPPPRWGIPAADLGIEDQAFRREWKALQQRRMTSSFSYTETLLLICERLDREAPRGVIEELDAMRCADKASCFDSIEDGVVGMLRSLREMGVATAVLSNCSVEEIGAFDRSTLASLVDTVVWSFDVGAAKPDPAIYQVACDRLRVEPARAAFVGDGSFGELDGAARAGLVPLWASWFVNRWPERLSGRRRAAVEQAGHREMSTPLDVVGWIRPLAGIKSEGAAN